MLIRAKHKFNKLFLLGEKFRENQLQPWGTHSLLEPKTSGAEQRDELRVYSNVGSHLAHVRQHMCEAEEEEETDRCRRPRWRGRLPLLQVGMAAGRVRYGFYPPDSVSVASTFAARQSARG